MLRKASFALIATLVPALAVQVPLNSTQYWQDDHHPSILGSDNLIKWNLDNSPNPNVTDHLVFETVHSLLHLWPNVRMRNGHSVVPGIVPQGTLLYHGRTDENLPLGPEWTATDPEHAFIFCRDLFNPSHDADAWLLTLMTTRPLKVIYFDGNSAAKLPNGLVDTQDLIAWGRLGDGDLYESEMKRVQDLCKWGKRFGIDGIVRMQPNFEVILCDFMSGVSVVSLANIESGWTSSQSTIPMYNKFELIHAGTWHYHLPGETRIQLDLPGLVSFYDTELAPSLIPVRADQERWDHRAANISSEDLAAIKLRLEANLARPSGASSGIDWKTLIRVIVDRFAQRFELTRYILDSSATNPDDILNIAKKAQTQLRIMVTPYLLVSATSSGPLGDLDWANPIYELCATTHTYLMESRFESMTDSEKSLLRAVRGTTGEICRTVTKMWATGVHVGIDPLLNTKESPNINEVAQLRESWAKELDRLMGWLDWHVWVKCNPACGPEEICYLPTWPVGFPWLAKFPNPFPSDEYTQDMEKLSSLGLQSMAMKRLADEMSSVVKPEPGEWIRPQPKCIRQVHPYMY